MMRRQKIVQLDNFLHDCNKLKENVIISHQTPRFKSAVFNLMKISRVQFIEISITNSKMLKKETKQEDI